MVPRAFTTATWLAHLLRRWVRQGHTSNVSLAEDGAAHVFSQMARNTDRSGRTNRDRSIMRSRERSWFPPESRVSFTA
jgi:hypothetical protein